MKRHFRPGNILGVPAIVIVAALILSACGGSNDHAAKSSSKSSAPAQTTTSGAAEVAATTPEAPPPPEPVSVAALGPFETTHDQIKLHGSVSPNAAKVRVDGQRASVKGGRWTKLVQIKHKGDNTFHVVATKAGHPSDKTSAVVTRKMSAAEKAAAKAAARQQFIASARNISYPQLLAHPTRYEGSKVVYRGQIFQVQEDGGSTVILLSVTDDGYGYWSDHIWVDYHGTINGAEGDILTVYGTTTGTQDYDTQAGGNTTVPSVKAKYIIE
jgi:hypothetical protein